MTPKGKKNRLEAIRKARKKRKGTELDPPVWTSYREHIASDLSNPELAQKGRISLNLARSKSGKDAENARFSRVGKAAYKKRMARIEKEGSKSEQSKLATIRKARKDRANYKVNSTYEKKATKLQEKMQKRAVRSGSKSEDNGNPLGSYKKANNMKGLAKVRLARSKSGKDAKKGKK